MHILCDQISNASMQIFGMRICIFHLHEEKLWIAGGGRRESMGRWSLSCKMLRCWAPTLQKLAQVWTTTIIVADSTE
jgi:hypothetical protein